MVAFVHPTYSTMHADNMHSSLHSSSSQSCVQYAVCSMVCWRWTHYFFLPPPNLIEFVGTMMLFSPPPPFVSKCQIYKDLPRHAITPREVSQTTKIAMQLVVKRMGKIGMCHGWSMAFNADAGEIYRMMFWRG